MFSLALPDPFMSVSCGQGARALISEKRRVIVVDPLMLVLYGKCQLGF